MKEKNCLFCKHFVWISGDRGYSEVTPGYPPELRCGKNHWDFDTCEDDRESMRKKLTMAETCADFVYDRKP